MTRIWYTLLTVNNTRIQDYDQDMVCVVDSDSTKIQDYGQDMVCFVDS